MDRCFASPKPQFSISEDGRRFPTGKICFRDDVEMDFTVCLPLLNMVEIILDDEFSFALMSNGIDKGDNAKCFARNF